VRRTRQIGVQREIAEHPDVAVPRELLVAIDATPLHGHQTGIGTFCREVLNALEARGDVNLKAFAVTWRGRQAITSMLPPRISLAGRRMPARPLHAIWQRRDVPTIERFTGPVDVVHGTNFVVPPSKCAAVVTVHDLTPLHYPEMCTPASQAYPAMIRRAVNRGAWVHAVSEFVAQEVREAFDVDPTRVRAVPHGVPSMARTDPENVRSVVARFLPPGTSRFVLAVGTAEPRKDLPGLVDVFDRVAAANPDLALVLAGPPGWGEKALSESIARARWQARIVRAGWIDPTSLSALLQGAELLAYPSLYEGFGFPPLQAMAAGTPVVTTRAGALPEIVGDAAILVDVRDYEGLEFQMQRVLSDEDLRHRMSRAGLSRAASFTWQNCANGLLALYRDAYTDHAGR
jgi:glycosyltransferase involved in cell wall biosynthesis